MDNATSKTRLTPAVGRSGPRTVYRAYWRPHSGAEWRTVTNADGNPIAYKDGESAMRAADHVRREALRIEGPFTLPYGGRELYAEGVPAFQFRKVDATGAATSDGPFTLSPTEADVLGRLIGEALNAYAPAVYWARYRTKQGEAPAHG